MNIRTRRRMKSFLLCLAILCSSSNLLGQVAYKGQLYINDESFQRKGELLHVYMKVSYDNTAIGSGESLTFTPVLKNDSNATYLASMVINGDRQEKASRRAAVLSRRRRNNTAVVVKENHTGKRYFVYETTVPYREWMERSALYVESEECNCNGHKGHLYEDRILAEVPFTHEPQETADPLMRSELILSWVQFLKPGGDEGSTFVKHGMIPWYDERQIGKLSEKNQNKKIFNTLSVDIKNALQLYGTSLTSVSVTGYGAPIGDYKKNESQASDRALSLKRYLMSNHLTNKNALSVTWMAEDWDSIASLISTSSMNLKEAALDIVKNVDVVSGRETVLENLNHGVPYAYLRHNIFPQVCRLTYKLTFTRKSMDTQTGRVMLRSNPSAMSLGDFYNVASSYKSGSREFNDIMDLAARIFPDNPEANIDAAAVALVRKDTELARKYLKRWQTDPRAYNNMGILYLMEGNRDKAEVYLQMAQAAGVEQATSVLNYLKTSKK